MQLIRFSGYAVVADHTVNILHGKAVEQVFQYHVDSSDILSNEEALELINNPDIDLAILEKHFVSDDNQSIENNPRIVIGGTYRHFKGKTVKLLNVAKYSEDATRLFAVYDCGENGIYARPLDMFLSEVDHEKYPVVEQKYRFELI